MTETTHDGGVLEGESHWVKRAVAVTLFLALIAVLVASFTRVIAARIPEQRATLEKLITDRTGLAVRFDNVHFAWDLEGTSAVFTRVELTDPKAGRVRVVAPELRVEFDTWDFLRHHQFSLGHVTLASPDIEITGDPEESMTEALAPKGSRPPSAGISRHDEAAMMQRYLRWAELMPVGRVEVEGARVHLLRRGDRAARHSFTLSQAVVSRGNSTFNAYGTLLLSQDVGQSLFVSAKLQDLGNATRVSGDLRIIARRVFLDRMLPGDLGGRGTLDASFRLRDGRIESGTWQANARELDLRGRGTRFDHVTLNGKLARDGQDLLLDVTDLQVTRGGRLQRAPAINARLAFVPASLEISRVTLNADRLPFMAAEFVAAGLSPVVLRDEPVTGGDWRPTAGELHEVRFDSGERRGAAAAWSLSARLSGGEFTRGSDQSKVSQLAAGIQLDAREFALRFDPAQAVNLLVAPSSVARPLVLAGELTWMPSRDTAVWRFEKFSVGSGSTALVASGSWDADAARARPLRLDITALDQDLLKDLWVLAAVQPPPALMADIAQANILEARLTLEPAADGGVNWKRSNGSLTFAGVAMTGADTPQILDASGSLKFAQGGTRVDLEAGHWEQLAIRDARLDWPQKGEPRLRVSLDGQLDAPPVRTLLDAQGLERLTGAVELDAEARGEQEIRDPKSWRVVARLRGATMPLDAELPPLEDLAGTVRYSAGQLRSLSLTGQWLGKPMEVESRRAGARGALTYSASGVADAAPLLKLLGRPEAARHVNGEFAWTGLAERDADSGLWQLKFASNLNGIESDLPAPFNKRSARSTPAKAELTVSREGIREFSIDSGSAFNVRGSVSAGITTTSFQIAGVAGELRSSGKGTAGPDLLIEQLELARASEVLAAASALIPGQERLQVRANDVRHAGRSFGPIQASILPRAQGIDFSAESSTGSIHQLSVQGSCGEAARCRAKFSVATTYLGALLRDVRLPVEWPAAALEAEGALDWPAGGHAEFAQDVAGQFALQALGRDGDHQFTAQASLSDGKIVISDIQGTGPEPDLVFRGSGRIDLVARDYEATVDYERVALAAAAVPSPARARLARAWSAMRGSVAHRGWTEAPETRRVQWHGTWE